MKRAGTRLRPSLGLRRGAQGPFDSAQDKPPLLGMGRTPEDAGLKTGATWGGELRVQNRHLGLPRSLRPSPGLRRGGQCPFDSAQDEPFGSAQDEPLLLGMGRTPWDAGLKTGAT